MGHHVYLQVGPEPDEIADPWVGSFPDPADAALAVRGVNRLVALGSPLLPEKMRAP